jgi:hypothetical protein
MVVANNVTVLALTADEMLRKGLILAGWEAERQIGTDIKTRTARFKSFYGSQPIVFVKIWEDLQTTDILEARINAKKHLCDHLLMCAYFLKVYPTETTMAGMFKMEEKTVRKWVWLFAKKIQALKKSKVRLFFAMLPFSRTYFF